MSEQQHGLTAKVRWIGWARMLGKRQWRPIVHSAAETDADCWRYIDKTFSQKQRDRWSICVLSAEVEYPVGR